MEELSKTLENIRDGLGLKDFHPGLARLKRIVSSMKNRDIKMPPRLKGVSLNPSVHLFPFSSKQQGSLANHKAEGIAEEPKPGEELILVWKDPVTGDVRVRPASREELIALKITVEGMDPKEAARIGNTHVSSINALVRQAIEAGILIAPPSKIKRENGFPRGINIDERFLKADVFSLQWHITQACDLSCKHCYDRTDRPHMPIDRALAVLDDLEHFCRTRFVRGQVSFSGGNPFLYPHFSELYRAASDMGFAVAILGNPVGRARLEEIVEIEKPVLFQVSLEGLKDHNDFIRGAGHFERTMNFLGLLRVLGIYSMVMLTLTKDNLDQVIPLAGLLNGKTDLFNFNRLSMVGEGANLKLPSGKEYEAFLGRCIEETAENPVMGLKDNLINILHRRKGIAPFGGCTGNGCGAAFNFVTLLPDGEVHACRKFPSRIGSIFEGTLSEIYDSEPARRYREGCSACSACAIRPVCGGCLAITHSYGLDIFEERDPFCFIDSMAAV
jgi:selenobiotic family peptide radical SAM maturase